MSLTRNIYLAILLFFLSVNFLSAQDNPLDKIVELASEKKELEIELLDVKKEKDSLKNILEKEIQLAIKKDETIEKLQKEKSDAKQSSINFQKKIKENEDELKKMTREITVLRKDSTKVQKFRLQKKENDQIIQEKDEAIERLNTKIKTKDEQIASLNESVSESKNVGRAAVIAIYESFYTRDFDELIILSSKTSAERDKEFVLQNSKGTRSDNILGIMDQLIDYFVAENLLVQEYSRKEVNASLNKLKSLPRSEQVESLQQCLQKYEQNITGIKEAFEAIQKLDSQLVANDYGTREMKINEMILPILTGFIFNYDFEFKDYPFLTELMMTLLKRKKGNPNADITDLIEKLK